MKISKKILFIGSLVASSLLADVATILPYGASLKYDSDASGSAKDKGTIVGAYFSYGNLSYLFDIDISHTNIKYKNTLLNDDLKQTDFTTTYSLYYPTYMFKFGIHHINTTDDDLGDGDTFILGVGGYEFIKYDKFSYGLEGYVSKYNDGHDDSGVKKSIKVYQLSPYMSYSKAIDIHSRNNIDFKINYINSDNFKDKDYSSFELSDTYYYDSYYINAKGYGGRMKAGVKDGGHTVYNTKDLYKSGYGLKLGYYAQKNLTFDMAYNYNKFQENGMTKDTHNSVWVATMRYSY